MTEILEVVSQLPACLFPPHTHTLSIVLYSSQNHSVTVVSLYSSIRFGGIWRLLVCCLFLSVGLFDEKPWVPKGSWLQHFQRLNHKELDQHPPKQTFPDQKEDKWALFLLSPCGREASWCELACGHAVLTQARVPLVTPQWLSPNLHFLKHCNWFFSFQSAPNDERIALQGFREEFFVCFP